MAQFEPFNQLKPEKTMLVQDKLRETKETAAEETSVQGSPTPSGLLAADVQRATRSSRSRRRVVWMLVATAALAGVVTLASVTQSDRDPAVPAPVSDGSFEVAEANRMETLRDLATGSVSDGSFEVAEANRMETLRDLATGS